MQIRNILLLFLCMGIEEPSVYCHILTFIRHYPAPGAHHPSITLLGDMHIVCSSSLFEIEHFKSLLPRLLMAFPPSTFLIEDFFATIDRKLNDDVVQETRLKGSLLTGLIQRINYWVPEFTTVCIERALTAGRAMQYAECYKYSPTFVGVSPEKLKKNGLNYSYNMSFLDVINEAKGLKKKLKERKQAGNYTQDEQKFIDSMKRKIGEQLENLYQILLKHNIKETESVKETCVRLWVLHKINSNKTQASKIVQVSHELESFISTYKQGMTKDEWLKRSFDLEDRCGHMLDVPVEPSPSLWAKFAALCAVLAGRLMRLPVIQKLFRNRLDIEKSQVVDKKEEPVLPWQKFDNPVPAMHTCLTELRMLGVDSHATLDVIDHKSEHVVLIAGDDHVQNITLYLEQLGCPRKEREVRDIRKHEMPLKLEKLPI